MNGLYWINDQKGTWACLYYRTGGRVSCGDEHFLHRQPPMTNKPQVTEKENDVETTGSSMALFFTNVEGGSIEDALESTILLSDEISTSQ